MKKEKITLFAVKEDLMKNVRSMLLVRVEARFLYIIPFTIISLLLYPLTYNIYVCLAVFTLALYHIVRFMIEYVELKKKKFSNKARRKYTATYVSKNLVKL